LANGLSTSSSMLTPSWIPFTVLSELKRLRRLAECQGRTLLIP